MSRSGAEGSRKEAPADVQQGHGGLENVVLGEKEVDGTLRWAVQDTGSGDRNQWVFDLEETGLGLNLGQCPGLNGKGGGTLMKDL